MDELLEEEKKRGSLRHIGIHDHLVSLLQGPAATMGIDDCWIIRLSLASCYAINHIPLGVAPTDLWFTTSLGFPMSCPLNK
jgi:hypothetical protein